MLATYRDPITFDMNAKPSNGGAGNERVCGQEGDCGELYGYTDTLSDYEQTVRCQLKKRTSS